MRRNWPTLFQLGVVLLLAAAPGLMVGCGDDSTDDAEITKISLQPATASIAVGASQIYAVQGTLSDGTTKNVTTDAEITVSDEDLATVSGSTVTGVAAGTVTVTAKYKSLTATATLTIAVRELESIQVTSTNSSIAVGTTEQFTATGNYSDGSTADISDAVTWSSSNETVATVNETGLATALEPGTTTITATLGEISGEKALEVTGQTITRIDVSPLAVTIPAGGSQPYTAEAIFSDGSRQTVTDQVTWESSDTAVATISAAGEATGVAAGQATISATLESVTPPLTGSATLTVSEAEVVRVEITPTLANTNVGGNPVQFTAQAILSDNSQPIDVTTDATWDSSDEAVATINATGEATPVAQGGTQITATYLGVTSAPATLVVGSAVVTEIIIEPATASIPAGTTRDFVATAVYSDESQVNVTSAASWQAVNTAVASMSTTVAGRAEGVAAGTSEIRATFGNMTGTAQLTVTTATLQSITISPADAQSIALGNSVDFTARGTYSDSTTADLTNQVTWQPTPSGILSITVANNVARATGAAVGQTTLRAIYAGVTSNAVQVTVTDAVLESLAITNPPDTAIPVGATYSFVVEGTYSDGSTAILTNDAVWDSSSDAVATISNSTGSEGVTVALSGGTTTITAAMGSITSQQVTLTVATGVSLSYIVVTPAEAVINKGQTRQFTATGYYTNGTSYNLTTSPTLTWSVVACDSLNVLSGYLTINQNGLATGVASTAGICGEGDDYLRVMATVGNIRGLAQVEVRETEIDEIIVQCEQDAYQICMPTGIGYRFSCVASAFMVDGTPGGEITDSASWSTSNNAAAVAGSTPGVIEIVGVGDFTVSATQGGVTGTTPVTFRGAEMTPEPVFIGSAIEIAPIVAEIPVGETIQYAAREFFTTNDTNCPEYDVFWYEISDLVTWSSANTNVAVINAAGLASGQAAGSTQIAAALGTQTSPLGILTVTNSCLQSVEIVQADPTYPTHVMAPLGVRGTYSADPSTSVTLTPATVNGTWSGVCPGWSIDQDTWQLTVGTGSCTLTFTASGTSVCDGTEQDTTAISTDANAVLTGVEITPASASINLGGEQDYAATATYASYGQFNVSVTSMTAWNNNPSISGLSNYIAPTDQPARRYDHTGTVGGTTTITVAYKNATDTASLDIAGRTVQSVAIDQPAAGASYPVGVQFPLQATVTYTDGQSVVNPTGITFISSDPNKLSIPAGSLVATTVAPSAGVNPTITARFTDAGVTSSSDPRAVVINTATLAHMGFRLAGDEGAFCEWTAAAPPPHDCIASLELNTTVGLQIRGYYSNGSSYDISNQVISASGNDAIVDVTTGASGTQILTRDVQTTGTPVTLSFIKDGITSWLGVNVTPGTCIESVVVDPTSVSIFAGDTVTLNATGTDTLGATAPLSGSWNSNNDAVLAGDGTGASRTYSGLSAGTATVTYTVSGSNICEGGNANDTTITTSATVQVQPAAVDAIYIRALDYLNAQFDPNPRLDLPVGESMQLRAWAEMTAGPDQNITTTATWSSQQSATVSVTANGGLITANAVGQTLITVTAGNGTTQTLLVNAVNCPLASLVFEITGSTAVLPVGQTRTLGAYVTYGNCSLDTNEASFAISSRGTWDSSSDAVATVSSSGLVTGVAAGTANITVAYRGEVSDPRTVTVVALTLTALTVTNNPAQVGVGSGGAVIINVSATWTGGGNTYTNINPPPVTWAISPASAISIEGPLNSDNTQYRLTGLTVSNDVQYRANYGLLQSLTYSVDVIDACFTGISITSPAGAVSWPRGVPVAFSYSCTTSDGSALACNPQFSQSSNLILDRIGGDFSDTGLGRMETNGALVGSFTDVTATINNNTCTGSPISSTARRITLGNAALSDLTVPGTLSMAKGTVRPLSATAVFSGGTGEGSYDVSLVATYSSSNNAIVAPTAPNPGSGTLTSQQLDGSAFVTAGFLGETSNPSTVTVSGRELVSIEINVADQYQFLGTPGGGADAQYPSGGYLLQLQAEGTFSTGEVEPLTGSVSWSLDPTTMVPGTTISDAGLMTTGTPASPATAGLQGVIASLSGIDGTFTVRLVSSPVATITIVDVNGNPVQTSIPLGRSPRFYAEVTTTDGNTYQAFRNVEWSSSNETVGSIVASGVTGGQFNAEALGSTNVRAGRGSVNSGPLAITVTDAVPESVFCVPGQVSLVTGGTAQVQGYLRDSNGDITPITDDSQTTWTTSNGSIASVSTTGLVTGGNDGTAYVYPAYPGATIANADRCQIIVQ